MHHRGGDERIFPVILHANGNTGKLKDVSITKERALPGFTDLETDFGETHENLLKRFTKSMANANFFPVRAPHYARKRQEAQGIPP
jgi:hypothetical protein